MINELEIHNFKSIKDLTLPCKRFNLFIGEPNTGKSNILEALGLVSFVGVRQYDSEAELSGFVRHKRLANLFYDGQVEKGLSVRCDEAALEILWADGKFAGKYSGPFGSIANFQGNARTITDVTNCPGVWSPSVRFYRRPEVDKFVKSDCGFLLPPYGSNLPSLLLMSDNLRDDANLAFVAQNLKLAFPGQGTTIELLDNYEDLITSYPYSLGSSSRQRQVFYFTALDTNWDTTLLFEEPEANSFLDDVKLLAEVIALEENSNQFFITTHSDCFLMSHLCKAPMGDLAVNIVYREDRQTKVKTLSDEELTELFEVNLFLNWERFVYP